MNIHLASERLLLRPLDKDDIDISTALLTDQEVMTFIGDVCTDQEVRLEHPNLIRRCAGGCIGIWCLTDRATREKLGTAVLLPLPIDQEERDWDLIAGDAVPEGDIEIGYMLKRSAWGKGYATEAMQRLLRFAFEETPLAELVATIEPANVASRRVLDKCGFVDEGLQPAFGGLYPGFRMTRDRWRFLSR